MALHFEYLMSVGTPYPVGERIQVDGKFKEVVGYEFGAPFALDILLDDGTRVTESLKRTDKVREKYIMKFLERGRAAHDLPKIS